MKRLGLLATVVALVAVYSMASADSVSTTFEPPAYTLGSVNLQPAGNPQHWGGQTPYMAAVGLPINPAIDQAVVGGSGRPASFGVQSWRISNAYTSGSFGDMPFSPGTVNEAGETAAPNAGLSGGARQNHFEASWSIASADAGGVVDNDSYFSASPDRGDGARMSYLRFEDRPAGVSIVFSEYRDNAPFGSLGSPATAALGCGDEDGWFDTVVATVSRNAPHSVRLAIDFVDGPRNDVVNVYVDGALMMTGTTWEDYFRWCTESGGGTGTAAADQSRTVDSVIFRVGGDQGVTHLANAGKGFFIDNVATASSKAPANADACKNGGWQSLSRPDGSSFKNQGDCVSYSNNGRGPGGNGTTHGNGHNKPN